MKLTFLSLFIFATTFFSSLFAQNNYRIELNDTTFEISLDKGYQLEIGGQMFSFTFSEKDTLTFEDEMYSFNYPKAFNVSKVVLDEGIEQIMVMTAAGSGFMIQKYSTINPSFLTEMLLSEVTKESINYGYELNRKDYSRIISSDQEVKVSKAVLTYKDEVNVYEVTTVGFKDEGLVIVTMDMGLNINSDGLDMIKLMWDSFQIHLK